jgi:hypothetical protein
MLTDHMIVLQSVTGIAFSQPHLAVLPIILPCAGAIIVEASCICDLITVYVSEIFHA